MNRKKIDFSMSITDVLITMAEGNPGAMTVLTQLIKEGDLGLFLILDLDDMRIRGPQIWVAYKDGCGQDINKLKEFCRNRTQSIVDIVNKNCAHDGIRAVTHGGSF